MKYGKDEGCSMERMMDEGCSLERIKNGVWKG